MYKSKNVDNSIKKYNKKKYNTYYNYIYIIFNFQ